MAHDNGAIIVVDGAQGAGAVRTKVGELGCDVYTASCQKWTLGPTASALLYVKKEVKEKMKVCEWQNGGSLGEEAVASFTSSFYTHRWGFVSKE